MAKSKHAPALFEVLDKAKEAKGQIKVPAWVDGGRADSEASSPAVETEAPVAIRPSRPVPAVPTAPSAAPAPADAGAGEPLWSYDGRRLRVSLSRMAAAAVAAGVVLAAAGVYRVGSSLGAAAGFEEGRRSYEAATVATIEQAKRQPVNEEVVGPLRSGAAAPPRGETSPPAAAPRTTVTASWVKGNTYIVVQEFRPDSGNEAYVAQGFFAEQGVPTAVVKRSSGHLWLVSTEGYNYGDPAQKQLGKVLAQRVRDVGKAYQQAGGRYACEGYERTLTGDSW